MQWWAGFWDAVAQFFGYQTWEWGPASEWIAAIFAGAALVVTLLILWRDRHRDADLVIVRHSIESHTREVDDEMMTKTVAKIDVHNGGSLPISNVSMIVVSREGVGSYFRDRLKVGKHWAEEDEISEKPYEPQVHPRDLHSTVKVVVTFMDGRNRFWVKESSTGRYISRAQYNRFVRFG